MASVRLTAASQSKSTVSKSKSSISIPSASIPSASIPSAPPLSLLQPYNHCSEIISPPPYELSIVDYDKRYNGQIDEECKRMAVWTKKLHSAKEKDDIKYCKDMIKCIDRKLDVLGCEKKITEYKDQYRNQDKSQNQEYLLEKPLDDAECVSIKCKLLTVEEHNLIALKNQLALAQCKYQGSMALVKYNEQPEFRQLTEFAGAQYKIVSTVLKFVFNDVGEMISYGISRIKNLLSY